MYHLENNKNIYCISFSLISKQKSWVSLRYDITCSIIRSVMHMLFNLALICIENLISPSLNAYYFLFKFVSDILIIKFLPEISQMYRK